MKNILTIMSKEFARFFGDRRMIMMTIMPAILIYAIYSFMGPAMHSAFAPDADHTPRIYAVNAPESIGQSIEQYIQTRVIGINESGIEEAKEKINSKQADLLMIFPIGFDDAALAYDVHTADSPAPNITIYYNSTEPNSQNAFRVALHLLDAYESSLANKFDINRNIENNGDMASTEDFMANIVASMLPMMLLIFLYSGCMGLALESITGEKERGTLATLLVSPLKRRELAIGKILSLAVLSFLAGAVTAAATILSLPNLMGSGGEAGDLFDANITEIYNITDYALLAFVILSVLLLLVAMISIVSAFSKTVKEAGQAAAPLMILVMVAGISGMFGTGQPDTVYFMLPLYGSVQSMGGIFSREYSSLNVIIACLFNLLYAGLGGFVLTKMFNSEKVMFSR
ncbi:MAG: ABC transporter permease [Oscillospiraceae bacterium]|nr:ABC transporter permease [Oscillospiraceae bacterium]